MNIKTNILNNIIILMFCKCLYSGWGRLLGERTIQEKIPPSASGYPPDIQHPDCGFST